MGAADSINVEVALRSCARAIRGAASVDSIGAALNDLARLFTLPDLIITDVGKVEASPSEALLFSARSLPDLRGFLNGRPLSSHPVFRRSWSGDAPFALSEVRHDLGLSESELWDVLPPWARGNEALSVNARIDASHFNFSFAGPAKAICSTTRSSLHTASQMAAERLGALQCGTAFEPGLTQRETNVLQLLAGGKSDTEVSATLGISARTVRFHLENAKRKLQVATRAQAVLRFLRG